MIEMMQLSYLHHGCPLLWLSLTLILLALMCLTVTFGIVRRDLQSVEEVLH
jgi:hypothetical protein